MAGNSINRYSFLRHPPLVYPPWRNKKLTPNPSRVGFYRVFARFGESDPQLRAALTGAWIRDQESRRSDPLFIDPYACGLLPSATSDNDIGKCLQPVNFSEWSHYRSTTKFIDERLHSFLSTSDQFRQMAWTRDHTGLAGPARQSYMTYLLKEFSIWQLRGLEGLPLLNSISFEELLSFISSLAMKGSIFFGELHIPSDWIISATKEEWLENVFLRHGFRVSIVKYTEVAGNPGLDPDAGFENPGSVLFVAEQLRMSDAQMEAWRMHLERMEEEADEEGFEEL